MCLLAPGLIKSSSNERLRVGGCIDGELAGFSVRLNRFADGGGNGGNSGMFSRD